MLRSLLNGALRSGALSGRGATRGTVPTRRGFGAGRRAGGGDVGSAVGGQVGRSLLGGLLRRR